MHDSDAGLQLQDVYAPPNARVADVGDVRGAATEFHVVSVRKFWCLYIATFGLYQFYWLYRQWAHYRAWHRESLWPAARAIFSIFFMHALNRNVDDSLREARTAHAWWPGVNATIFVLLSVVSGISDRLAARVETISWLDYVGIALILPIALTLAATQRAANAACGDPAGAGNARLTLANWIWIVLGMLWWALIVIGLIPEEAI